MPKNRGRLSSNWAQIKDSVGVKYTMVLFTPIDESCVVNSTTKQ